MKRKKTVGEHHVANVRVEGSNPFARSKNLSVQPHDVKPCIVASQLSYTRVQQTYAQAVKTGKAQYFWDRGIGFRVTPKGLVTWQVHLKGHRKAYRTLQEAEKDYIARKAPNLIPGGFLPVQATTLATPPRKAALDLSGAWETYIQERGEDSRYWRELDRRFKVHVLPSLQLTKQGIREALASKAGSPVAQRTLWEGLSPFLKWLVAHDYLPSNPMVDLIPPRVPKSRDRVLSDDELARVWNATFLMPLWGPFFRLLILTAQRRNEVSGMDYREIEVASATWTIPGSRTKNGKTHLVHLSLEAMAIINSKPQFIGRGVSGFSKAKAILDRYSGITNYRIHDFRRTAATGMARLGVDPGIVERVLNHYQGSVYQRFEYQPQRRTALELWGTHLSTISK